MPNLLKTQSKQVFPEADISLPLLDDNTPWVLLVSVHDVAEPAFQLLGVHATLAVISHGDGDILAAMVNQGNGADEVLRL